MSTQNPNENIPPHEDDVDESEALKRAILKLKNSGMLTHVPDELENLVPNTLETVESQQVKTVSTETNISDDEEDSTTLHTRPKQSSPTVASTSDDVEKHADERAKWAAVMSGWDDETPEIVSWDAPNAPSTVVEEELTDVETTIVPQPAQEADSWNLTTEIDLETPDSVDDQAAITIRRREIKPEQPDTALTGSREQTPWALQQFFDGEIDLEQELLKRFPSVPAMTTIKFRTLGLNSSRKVATLSTQDGGASLIVDADVETKVVQLSFTFGSMMTLRYALSDLPANNRERWLELMRREKGGLAFLWNEDRWREDYLICVSREYSTNIFAFSPHNFESAVRLTKKVTNELLTWLEDVWISEPELPDDDDSPLLTW